MANYTFSSNTNLCDFIDSTSNYDSADNIFINNGAIVTIDRSPASSLGNITINDGDLFIDGANATNPIHMWGRRQKYILPAGSSGRFISTTGWYTHASTGDGSANQTLDMTDYWEGASGAGDFTDVINGLWMEDTVQVSFSTPTVNIAAPAVGDWVDLDNDKKVFGRVVAYDASAGTIQIEGFPQTLASGDVISVIKEQDVSGPQMKKVWQATLTSGETLVTGVWMKMVNLTKHSDDSTPTRLNAKSGQGFTNVRFNNTITFPFKKPRNGAHFRFNKITVGTVNNEAGFNSQTPYWEANELNRYDFNGNNAGTVISRGINWGGAYCGASNIGSYTLEQTSCSGALGTGIGSKTVITDSIFAHDFSDATIAGGKLNGRDSLPGITCDDILLFHSSGGSNGVFKTLNMNDVTLKNSTLVADWAATVGHAIVSIENCDIAEITNNVLFGAVSLSRTSNFEVVNNRVSQSPLQVPGEMTHSNGRSLACYNVCTDGLFKAIRFDACSNQEIIYVTDCFRIKARAIGCPDHRIAFGNRFRTALAALGAYAVIDYARVYTDQYTGTGTGNPQKVINAQRTGNNVVLRNIHGHYQGEIEPSANLQDWRSVSGGGDGGLNTTLGMEVDITNTYGQIALDYFSSTTTGNLAFTFREPSTLDNSVGSIAITGNYFWDRKGRLGLYDGAVATYEMPYYAKGHTGFSGDVTIHKSNTSANHGVNSLSGNVTLEFQYDLNDGNGYNGSWLSAATASNLTGITINPANGIKVKWKLSNNDGQTRTFNGLLLETTTTLAAQEDNLWPIDQNLVNFTLTGLQANTEVRVYLTGTTTELFGVENSGTTFTNQYLHTGSNFGVDIVVHHQQYEAIRLENIVLTATAASIPIQQQFDRQYSNP